MSNAPARFLGTRVIPAAAPGAFVASHVVRLGTVEARAFVPAGTVPEAWIVFDRADNSNRPLTVGWMREEGLRPLAKACSRLEREARRLAAG